MKKLIDRFGIQNPASSLVPLGLIMIGSAAPMTLVCEPETTVSTPAPSLIQILQEELDYSMQHLESEVGLKPYYLAYSVTDTAAVTIQGKLGAIYGNQESRRRQVDVDLRVGDYSIDNTHQLRGNARGRGSSRSFTVSRWISLDDDPSAIKHALWLATDQAFKSATERYQQVLTNLKTQVQEEATVADFSREEPNLVQNEPVAQDIDRAT